MPSLRWKTLRVGYLQNEFEVPAKAEGESAEQKRDFADRVYDAKYGVSALDTLRKMGVKLIPMKMPKGYHFGDITPVLEAEAAAAFDELTLSGRDKLLTGQTKRGLAESLSRGAVLFRGGLCAGAAGADAGDGGDGEDV